MKGRIFKSVVVAVLAFASQLAHAGTVTYVYTDPQGTPLAEANASGTITATFDYQPYGSQALGSPKAGPGYTGHVNDPDTGFVYMQARYYDPVVGRFLGGDPVRPAAGNMFGFNRYDYVDNNPIAGTDPDGRFPFYTHVALTFHASRIAGIGLWASLRYAIQAGWADLRPHAQDTTEAAVAQHAMSLKGEPIERARANYGSLVSRDRASGKLGYAAHAIQDSFARAHKGFQVWDGKFFSAAGLKHVWADVTASSGELNDALGATVEMFRSVQSGTSSGNEKNNEQGPAGGFGGTGSEDHGGERTCGYALVIGCNSARDPLPDSGSNTGIRRGQGQPML